MNQREIKSKANAVVSSLTKASRPSEKRQGDGAASGVGEKENLIPPMLLAGLISTASKSKKRARTLADTKLEMEVIGQCGSGGLDYSKLSRTNMVRMKLRDNSAWSSTVGSQNLTQLTWRIPPGAMWSCSRRGTQ